MSVKPHIGIVCSRLDLTGGTERAIVNLANLFSENGHQVSIFIMDVSTDLFYSLHPSINIIQAPFHFGITNTGTKWSRKKDLITHVKKLNALIQKTNISVLIGTEYHLSIVCWLAARKLHIPIIAWEHHHFYWIRKNMFWKLLFRFVYPRLHRVVCQNNREQQLFKKMGCITEVIPYVVPFTTVSEYETHNKTILTIGWLIKRKGIDLLPEVAKKVFENNRDWLWKVIGSGEEYENLIHTIKAYGLSENIKLLQPASSYLKNEYLNASVFVLLSRFECLPMVLLEAITYGLPAIAFDCPTGPAEIIQNGINGYLCTMEDVDAMSDSIITLMNNDGLRKKMSDEAYVASKKYQPEKIYMKWIKLIRNL